RTDGAIRLCLTRIAPIRDATGTVVAYAESHRDAVAEGLLADELRDRLYGLRHGDALVPAATPEAAAIREELAALGAAFRDLERAIQQYQRLLPLLAADDPLAEAIAGVAHETQAALRQLRVEDLLRDIPRRLARLHA